MIVKLRRRHRAMWVVLALFLPAIIYVGWRARRPTVVMERIPPALLH